MRNFLLSTLLITSLSLLGCTTEPTSTGDSPDEKISVVTSFYPLYFFAKEIGGNKVQILNITPAGAEPHDYEPTAKDIAAIQNSKLLILNGGGLETWSDNIQKNTDPKKTLIISVGEDLVTQADPHVWLSPTLAQKMADKIADGFIQKDSANQAYYEANTKALKMKLGDLDSQYKNSLKNCKQKNIVTSHSAFGHLATSYGFTQMPISGLSPDAEPSAKQLAEISDFAKKNDVKYIFFESLVSPKLSETVANEIGAKTLVLNPLEGLNEEELSIGKNYFTEMLSNLDNLKIALKCTK